MSNRSIGYLSRYLRARTVSASVTSQSRRSHTANSIVGTQIEYLKNIEKGNRMKHQNQGPRSKGHGPQKKQKPASDYNFGKGDDPEQALQIDVNRLLETARKERDNSESPARSIGPNNADGVTHPIQKEKE